MRSAKMREQSGSSAFPSSCAAKVLGLAAVGRRAKADYFGSGIWVEDSAACHLEYWYLREVAAVLAN